MTAEKPEAKHAVAGRVYIETFENGPGGWLGWASNREGAKRLEIRDGVAISRSPWWIDYNHAPPGAGYLHILFSLHTRHDASFREQYKDLGGPNRFVSGAFPTDFTNAKLTVRLEGELESRGAQLVLLVQAKVGSLYVGCALMGQPFQVTREWSEQTIRLEPDPTQWKAMGAKQDRVNFYGWGDVADVLRDVNCNILLVLYPLTVVPAETMSGDPHLLRAGEDYRVDLARLPEGFVMLDKVQLEFPSDCTGAPGAQHERLPGE